MSVKHEVRQLVEELYAGLDRLPYHAFLGIGPEVEGESLRAAFYQRARLLHPDRFFSHPDRNLRAKVHAVYKRITEGYRVLIDPELRRSYEERRAQGPEVVRLDQRDRPAPPKRPEDAIAHPGAKKYFLLALEAERRGDTRSAKLNLSLALQLDPQSTVLKEKLEKCK